MSSYMGGKFSAHRKGNALTAGVDFSLNFSGIQLETR